MNRERRLAGYIRELGLDPVAELCAHAGRKARVSWVDLCCGTGRALIEAVKLLVNQQTLDDLRVEGVDLVGMFDPNPVAEHLTLVPCAIESWVPSGRYALATCVHGLHYVGDKLAAIAKMAACLANDGCMVASFDPSGVRFGEGLSGARAVVRWLREHGIAYNSRRHVIQCTGPRRLTLPWRYLGADDRVGPNYTGQPAVASHYEEPRNHSRKARARVRCKASSRSR